MAEKSKITGGYGRLKKKYETLLATHNQEMANAEAKIKELEEKNGKMVKDRYENSVTIKEKVDTIRDKEQIIGIQANKITELRNLNANLQADARFYEELSKKYWFAMGSIRRWLYLRKQQ